MKEQRTFEEILAASRAGKGEDECWPWALASRGYGVLRGAGAHRLSWAAVNGPIPSGLMICHHCDNPPCVNPRHLYAGTAKDNMRDAKQRGRLKMGPRRQPGVWPKSFILPRGARKLSLDSIEQIKRWRLLKTPLELAREFGVSENTVRQIIRIPARPE